MEIILINEPSTENDFLLLGAICGQLIKFKLGYTYLLGSRIYNTLNKYYKMKDLSIEFTIPNYRELTISLYKNIINDIKMDKYYYVVKKEDNIYDVINKITGTKCFVIPIFDISQMVYLPYYIKEIKKLEDYKEFNKKNVIIVPKKKISRIIDLGIAMNYKMENTILSFNKGDLEVPFKVYGWANDLSINGVEIIPMEYKIVRDISKQDGVMFSCVTMYNAGLQYSLNYPKNVVFNTHTLENIVKDKNKHYISFIMSDGDNVSFYYFRFIKYLLQERENLPLTWTINPGAPEVLLDMFYDEWMNQQNVLNQGKNDYFICAPSGNGYSFFDLSKNSNIKETEDMMLKKNLSDINIINGGLNIFHKNDYNIFNQDIVKNVIEYHFLNYSLNKKEYMSSNGINIRYGNKKLFLSCDKNKFLNSTFKKGEKSIIPVCINTFDVYALCDIVNKLKKKYDYIEFINLKQYFDI